MANLVKYGNFDFASVCGYDPFVGVSDEAIIVGGKFKTLKKITVQGKILPTDPNCANEGNNITSKINQLIFGLRNDFQFLKVGDLELNYAKCESVDIDQSSFFGGANFTATFSAYPSSLSENNFHILDPVDNREFTEGEDGVITISRQISVRGVTANGKTALENAREFINNGLTIPKDKVPPIFLELGQLKGPGNNNTILSPRRMVETINRMEGSISIDVDFVYRNNVPTNNTILSYSVDVGYDDKSGIYTANLNGSLVRSDINSNSEAIRASLKTSLNSLNFFNLTINIFRRLTGFNYLNPEPESFSIKEDIENNTISFNYSYVSDPFPVKQSIGYDIQYDNILDITTVSISGNLTARGPQKSKKAQLESALSRLNLYNLAQSFFTRYGVTKNPNLNKNPENYSITRNKYGSGDDVVESINISATYSNRYLEESGLIKFDYNLSARPSIDVYLPVQFLDGSNGMFNMNFYKRATISVNGSALGKNSNLASTVRNLAISKLNSLASAVGASSRIRTQDNVTRPRESDDGYIYNFTIEENCETRKHT
jgi:hypothetical protein